MYGSVPTVLDQQHRAVGLETHTHCTSQLAKTSMPTHIYHTPGPNAPRLAQSGDMPTSAQMTESPINTNTKNSGMRVEGRVTHPSKSTRRYAVVTRDDEEQQEAMKNNEALTKNDEK